MANAPSAPWKYECEHDGCTFYITVSARGARGNDPGSGVQAAQIMQDHVDRYHPARKENDMNDRDAPDVDMDALAVQVVNITKEPLQRVGRALEGIAGSCSESEVWWRRKREAATTPEDVLTAAIGGAYARGAGTMASTIADAIQKNL